MNKQQYIELAMDNNLSYQAACALVDNIGPDSLTESTIQQYREYDTYEQAINHMGLSKYLCDEDPEYEQSAKNYLESMTTVIEFECGILIKIPY